MQKRERLRLEAQAESLDVCVTHRKAFDASKGGQNTLTTMSSSLAAARHHTSELDRWVDERTAATQDTAAGRAILRHALEALGGFASLVPLDESATKVLHAPRNASDESLLSVAREAMDKLTPHSAQLVEQGLPESVLTDLPKQIEAFDAARARGQRARREYTLTTARLKQALDTNQRTIGIAMTILRTSPLAPPDAAASLKIAKRIGPRINKKEESAPAPPAGTTKVA